MEIIHVQRSRNILDIGLLLLLRRRFVTFYISALEIQYLLIYLLTLSSVHV